MRKIIILLLIASLAAACGGKKAKTVGTEEAVANQTEETIDAAHNSLNSVDYLGTYLGNLPCADCEGIRTEITLGENTYTMKLEYLGQKKDNVSESSGEYEWDNTGSIITLKGEPTPNRYKVGENTLIKLDADGKVVEGALADNYILRKI